MPPAYSEMIMSDSPPSRRLPLGTSCGSKLLLRSRGVIRSTSPTSVPSRFGMNPLRELPTRDQPGHASHNPDGRSTRPAAQPPAPASPAPAKTRPPRSAGLHPHQPRPSPPLKTPGPTADPQPLVPALSPVPPNSYRPSCALTPSEAFTQRS